VAAGAFGFTVVVVVDSAFDDFQTSFFPTLAQTKGAFFVPERKPTFEHFCPALAADTAEKGKPANSNEALRVTVNKNFDFID
jgi:hypothetical protein